MNVLIYAIIAAVVRKKAFVRVRVFELRRAIEMTRTFRGRARER